jgi:hypothetical protein
MILVDICLLAAVYLHVDPAFAKRFLNDIRGRLILHVQHRPDALAITDRFPGAATCYTVQVIHAEYAVLLHCFSHFVFLAFFHSVLTFVSFCSLYPGD